MPNIPFSVLSVDALVEHVTSRIHDGTADGAPAFALILGSGFSFPLFPTAAGMVKRDIAWWKYALAHKLEFTDLPAESARDALDAFAREMWASTHQATGGSFDLDANTGLPADNGDNIGSAYQAIMSGKASKGLNTPKLRRTYFRDLCKRVDKRINLAHLYLGSLLHGQAQKDWKDKGRATFTRTILTTNFDPLLQRALQLHNVLYFMSDQPEGGIAPPDDDEQAVHLVYTHGSVHRRHLANNPSEILSLSTVNATALSGYFARQGVIVVGYSGWNDTTFQALRSCPGFDGNLYWCGRESGEQAATTGLRSEVREFLAKNPDNRFYVELGAGGADDLLHRLHKSLIGALPTALVDPAGLMIDELASVTWPEKSTKSLFDGLEDLAQGQLKLLREFTGKNRTGATTTTSSLPTSAPRPEGPLSAASLNVRASVAFHSGELEEAIRCLTMIEVMPEAPPWEKARALILRGAIKGQMVPPNTEDAITDYSTVVAMPDATADQRARALVNRGATKVEMIPPNFEEAIKDYDAVLAMLDAPAEQKIYALLNRGITRSTMFPPDVKGAIADCTAILAMPGVSADQQAMALANRGYAKGWMMSPPDIEGAIADCDEVMAMPDAPASQIAMSAFNLACLAARRGDVDEALRWLKKWRKSEKKPGRHYLDNDDDFDAIRHNPAFVDFRSNLPEDAVPDTDVPDRTRRVP